jgi:hypothetical protein
MVHQASNKLLIFSFLSLKIQVFLIMSLTQHSTHFLMAFTLSAQLFQLSAFAALVLPVLGAHAIGHTNFFTAFLKNALQPGGSHRKPLTTICLPGARVTFAQSVQPTNVLASVCLTQARPCQMHQEQEYLPNHLHPFQCFWHKPWPVMQHPLANVQQTNLQYKCHFCQLLPVLQCFAPSTSHFPPAILNSQCVCTQFNCKWQQGCHHFLPTCLQCLQCMPSLAQMERSTAIVQFPLLLLQPSKR